MTCLEVVRPVCGWRGTGRFLTSESISMKCPWSSCQREKAKSGTIWPGLSAVALPGLLTPWDSANWRNWPPNYPRPRGIQRLRRLHGRLAWGTVGAVVVDGKVLSTSNVVNS